MRRKKTHGAAVPMIAVHRKSEKPLHRQIYDAFRAMILEALKDWHMNTYHKNAKEWAVRSGAIMEDIITNFEFKNARLIRVCPCCAHIQDQPYDRSANRRFWRSLPEVYLQLPGDAGDIGQHGGFQGRLDQAADLNDRPRSQRIGQIVSHDNFHPRRYLLRFCCGFRDFLLGLGSFVKKQSGTRF